MFTNLLIKIIGFLSLLSGGLYLDWTFRFLNWSNPFLALATLLFAVFSFIITITLVLNNWYKPKKEKHNFKLERYPKVGIIIPIWSESVDILQRTLDSVITQNYPKDKIVIVVTDDKGNVEVKNLCYFYSQRYQVEILYNRAPEKNSSERRGEGKAGNLNSAFDLIKDREDIEYIETRDVDDLLGDKDFLSKTVSILENNPKVAYVQTIKDNFVSKKDPFSNRERFFYHSIIANKNSVNAVFPCGSGLVWRKVALNDIDGFSDWNLVEDVQSGIDALSKGWEGRYLPIVGAVGQIAPEDLQNVIKQRTTWAMDSFRLFFWGDVSKLNFKQRLQFLDAPLVYLFSITTLLQTFVTSYTLVSGTKAINGDLLIYALHVVLHVFINILFITAIRRDSKVKDSEVIKSVMLILGLGPQLLVSLIKVLVYGKNKKPKYVLTRKFNLNKIYLNLVFPQIVVITILLGSTYFHIMTNNHIDYANIMWTILYSLVYFKTIKLSWFGFKLFGLKRNANLAYSAA